MINSWTERPEGALEPLARAHPRVARLVAALALQLRGHAAGRRRPVPVRRPGRAPRGGVRPGGDRRRAHRDREAHDRGDRQRDRRLQRRSSTRSADRADEGLWRFTIAVPARRGDRGPPSAACRSTLSVLAEAGIDASGTVVEGDPFAAAERVTAEEDVHEIILATYPTGRSGWMADDMVDRLRKATGLGITRVVVRPEEARAAAGRSRACAAGRRDRRRGPRRRRPGRRAARARRRAADRRRPALPDGPRAAPAGPTRPRSCAPPPFERVRAAHRRASRRPASRPAARCSTATPPRPRRVAVAGHARRRDPGRRDPRRPPRLGGGPRRASRPRPAPCRSSRSSSMRRPRPPRPGG